MTDDGWSQGWQLVEHGGERFRQGRIGSAAAWFGCGPARGGMERAVRLERLARLLGIAVRSCNQAHGRAIASLGCPRGGPPSGGAEVGICDGLITDRSGLALAVWTADCVPVLISGDGVVAAVHAGWKGAAAGIVAAAVRRFGVEYGVPPGRLEVALGPAVGPCHYPVGGDVVSALSHALPGPRSWLEADRVDLRRFLEMQLTGLGVGGVTRVGPCTACDPVLASSRRDGSDAGRQWSAVALAS